MAKQILETSKPVETVGSSLDGGPPREAWVGRLRYVVVPILAVLAIAVAIYVLEGGNGLSGDGSADLARASGVSAVNLGAPTGDAARVPAPRVGYPAPDFTLTSLDGKPTKLSDFRGKTVFLNFFATWCPPCRAEMPDIAATYAGMNHDEAVVLAVDLQEETSIVANYASSVELTFPIVLDRSGYVSAMYRINGLPTSFFIDKEGVIRDMQIGPMSKQMMQSRLQKAM
jgi:cytochrome c biogenesis protein CcmG/thiol:disulfide interchange protein DsbE